MKEPTDFELTQYWETKMPHQYGLVLQEFLYRDLVPLVYRPGRRLAYSTLEETLVKSDSKILSSDAAYIVDQLVEHGLLIEHEEPVLAYSLSELGERLVLARFKPNVVKQWIPALPAFSWAS
jgi:hypothetical protein